MNYRGYGLSEGKPEQVKILQDCHSALSMLVEQGHLKADGFHLIGRSLGSGVAGYLCAKIGARMACLVTPYDSVLRVAQKKYWYLPVGLMFRHPFDAMPWAQDNVAPMMMILSEKDETVPHQHSHRLFAAWKGPKTHEILEGTDHSTIVRHEAFFSKIASFFDKPVS
jgi:pimeloyl-ACP methyl ester carboxylesterase